MEYNLTPYAKMRSPIAVGFLFLARYGLEVAIPRGKLFVLPRIPTAWRAWIFTPQNDENRVKSDKLLSVDNESPDPKKPARSFSYTIELSIAQLFLVVTLTISDLKSGKQPRIF